MKRLLIGAAAFSLLGGAAAQAQPYYSHHDAAVAHHAMVAQHRADVRAERRDERRAERRWARGQYLPRAYWGGGYVVNDWRYRHLRPPPRGYHWVRVNNDYVLAAVTTGLIADIIANSR
jgi:Ni/Co efflux regulator RcnB